jgi:hypothetical protein
MDVRSVSPGRGTGRDHRGAAQRGASQHDRTRASGPRQSDRTEDVVIDPREAGDAAGLAGRPVPAVVERQHAIPGPGKGPGVRHPDAEVSAASSTLVREDDGPRATTEQDADQPHPVDRPETHDATAFGPRYASLLEAKRGGLLAAANVGAPSLPFMKASARRISAREPRARLKDIERVDAGRVAEHLRARRTEPPRQRTGRSTR